MFLMATNGEKWQYLAVESLPVLCRGKTSENNGDFYCLNLHSVSTENRLKKHENACRNKDYCHKEMPKRDKNILKYNYGEKSINIPFIIYLLESLLQKIDTCDSNHGKSSKTNIYKHTASGCSLFTHCSFDATKNKRDY